MDQINKRIDDIITTLNTVNIFKSNLIQKNLSNLEPDQNSVRYIDFLSKFEQDLKDQKHQFEYQIMSDLKEKISNRFNALIDAATTFNDYNKILKVLRLLKIKLSSDRCIDDDTLEYDNQQIDSL